MIVQVTCELDDFYGTPEELANLSDKEIREMIFEDTYNFMLDSEIDIIRD